MPESEPKPKLIELVGPGAGPGWKAVLRSGKPVVVHEIPVPPAEATASVPRMQRLYEHRHPALSPVLAWGTDPAGIWVAVEPNEGIPLGTILNRGPLTPPAAAALGAAVLSGVAALHEAGIAMGGFNASAVRVTANGEVRLAGHPAAAVRGAPAQSDLRADVRSCGMAVCAAFGVDPAGAPAPANITPGLVVTMRSMASGAMGPAADRAQGALREMASALLAPDRQMAAQSELATRAGGREVPPVTLAPQGQSPEAGPQTAAAAAAAPGPAVPFVPAVPKDETPIRAPVSYEAPDRPVQTYSGLPAIPVPVPAPPPPTPSAPRPSTPAVPTWDDPPARTPSPFEAPAAASAAGVPAATPPAPAPPAEPAVRETFPPAPAPPPPVPVWTPDSRPAPSTNSPAPPAPAPAPPAPAAPAAPMPIWTPVEPPVWQPGEVPTSGPADSFIPAAATAGAAAAADTPTDAAKAAVPEAKVSAPPWEPAPAAYVAGGATATPLGAPAPIHRPAVPQRAGGGLLAERPPWLIPAAAAVVVILLLGIFAFVLTHRGNSSSGGPVAGASPSARTTPKGSPKASPKTSPSPTGGAALAVPTFSPTSADAITKVQFCSPATPCPIGAGTAPETATTCDLSSCTVEVAVYFSSQQKVPVSYAFKLFDRCTGQTTDLPGPAPYTPPGYAVVIPRDKYIVTLPARLKSAALVAVAQQPAVAYSAPLLLGPDSCA